MGKIIDFNEWVNEAKKLSIIKSENEFDIRGHEGSVIIRLNLKFPKIKHKCFLINFIRDLLGIRYVAVEEISEEECKSMFINDFRKIFFKNQQNEYESLWMELKEELIKSSNFKYAVIIGSIADLKNNFTYIESKVFSIKKNI